MFIDSFGKEHEGEVLGVTKDYFWLLAMDLKTVFVDHPNCIERRNGKEYIQSPDHAVNADSLFNSQNRVESYIFDLYCDDPEDMKRHLDMLRLLRVL
ncbi:hypothetical protein R0135_14165 [Congregibacter variabilis]|uniref:Uncharacterized protein n=1 Tax=Congregibacter variabilis TaxID=3081200 RepID=A0ABZ0I081_9GAMM|nr:hypothetical protein R0135_14165 [Congregibacter sp. IMCC43200]